MGLVEDEHHPLSPLVLLGGQGVLGLGDEGRPVEPGDAPEGGDDGRVQAPQPDRSVAEVDDGVTAGVDAGKGGPDRHRLAGTHLAGHHHHHLFVDAPGDPGHRFYVGAVSVEHGGCEVLGEGHAGEAPVGTQAVQSSVASKVWSQSSRR